MDYFKFLPMELKLDILTRLPTESVLNCKSVCTSWKNHVRHPSFSKMHLHRLNNSAADSGELLGFIALTSDDKLYYIEFNGNQDEFTPIQRIRRVNFTLPFNRITSVGLHNGLVCLSKNLSVCICNPITREYVILPDISKTNSYCGITRGCNDGTISFGYVSSTNEYKVVGIYVLEREFVEVKIYTLGSGKGWRNLGKFNHSEFSTRNWCVAGIFANEALYWLHRDLEMITTFDFAEEKFSENLSPPPLQPGGRWLGYRIRALNGFLSFVVYVDVEGERFYDIWRLEKKRKEEHQSSIWTKEFRIDRSMFFGVTKTDGVLTRGPYCLTIYNTKTSTSKEIVKFEKWLVQVSPHKNTFVSLEELGEQDTEAMGFVEIEEAGGSNYTFEQL